MSESTPKQPQTIDEVNAFLKADFRGEKVVDAQKMLHDFQSYDATIPDRIVRSDQKDSRRLFVRASTFFQLTSVFELYLAEAGSSLTDEQFNAIIDFNYKYRQMGGTSTEQVYTTPAQIREALDVLELLGVDMSAQRAQLAASVQRLNGAAAD